MSRPLPPGDPARLGPFRLSARLSESSAGIVYLGMDDSGQRASVAVLNRGAAGDAAARDRFRAAITSELPGPGRPPRLGATDPAPIVAAQPEGEAPWVATSYDADRSGRAGAERFLEPVTLAGSSRGRWAGRLRGPQFQPYWLGAGEGPALERPPAPYVPAGPAAPERADRGLVAAILTLAGILAALALLMLLLFACQPSLEEPPPPPPGRQTTPAEPTPTPSRTTRRPSPNPTPTTPPPTPSPGETGGGGGGGPL
ncbi:hypothetical protein [Actinomadura sp. 9N407]|uniref:hypothetical protein n=1 Tax=Actinomadura sp. 9N407 TaxID=3375154 RepID=UPI0037AA224F